MDIEQLQDRLSAALLQLRLDQLHEVCVYEKLSVEGQSKRHSLIRLISEAVENVIDTEDEDVARQHVKDLLEFSSGITQRSDRTIHDGGGDADRNSAELAHLKKQYAELQHHFELSTNVLKSEIQRLSLKVPDVPSSPVFSQHQHAVPEVTIRRRTERGHSASSMTLTTHTTSSLWPEHQSELLCDSIKQLEAREAAKQKESHLQLIRSISANQLSTKHNAQLLNLIGEKCMVNCFFDGVPTQALWDTGSQVCLMNEKWRKEHLPHTRLRSLEEILGPGSLTGRAVNQTVIPFESWVEVTFKLGTDKATPLELEVPVLVCGDDGVAEEPIIGYNVIEYLLNSGVE
ncbi:hypothetical protein G5714_007528 [Onychostoma macrolepis]|uniref:Uncharacterized protein n=1 Tax=Onychostoma macrolepis TaxID=369639 RepID=A0A7J6CT24_9TELE|nr:hypothetical protein G5714_007528 [Onychostoma macrolepis]